MKLRLHLFCTKNVKERAGTVKASGSGPIIINDNNKYLKTSSKA